jgi:hypothetical protein
VPEQRGQTGRFITPSIGNISGGEPPGLVSTMSKVQGGLRHHAKS